MYAGHLGFALGAQSFRRTIPLWLLLLAAEIPDWLDVTLCSLAVDRGPAGLYSHGLPTVALCAFVLAALYVAFTRDAVGALIVAITVASHYALDVITGIKPTWLDGPFVGLELYSRPAVELSLEGATVLIGWWLYRRALPATERTRWTVYAILLALLVFQAVAGIAFYLNLGGNTKC